MAESVQKKSKLKTWLPLILIGGFMTIAFAMGWHKYLTVSALVENREMLGNFVESNFSLTLFTYVLLYILVVTLSLPGAGLLSVTGGLLFGWLISAPVTIFAATLGATILFLVVKTSLGSVLRAKVGAHIEKFQKGFDDDAFNYLLFLRLVPLFPFWLVNLAPALIGIRVVPYVAATFLGIIPGTFALAFVGAGLDSVIDAQRTENADCLTNPACQVEISLGALITPQLLGAFAALGVVALIPVVIKKLRKKPIA